MNSSPKQTAGLYHPKHQQSLDVREKEEKNAKTHVMGIRYFF